MDTLLSEPPSEQTCDLAMAIAAVDRKRSPGSEPTEPPDSPSQRHGQRATSTRRALAITALGGLFMAGIAVLTSSAHPHSATAAKADFVFDNAHSGDCLSWPNNSPDQAYFVACKDQHFFEVADSVDMRDSHQPCQLAVQRYLGPRYDPYGKFTIAVLWSGGGAGPQPGDRRLLCGLQLLGLDKGPVAFNGKIAELDQSKAWPAGTCLGIDSSSNQPTDIPVDCSAPHAQEVTGVLNLGEAFPGAPPTQAVQDTFIRDACTRITDAYLSPIALHTTGLTLIYSTVPDRSWLAGSRQASCGIGTPPGDRGWATLNGSAKGRLLVNGVPPVTRQPATEAPPDNAPDQPPTTPPIAALPLNPVPTQPQASPSSGTTVSPAPPTTSAPSSTSAPSTTSAPSSTSAPPTTSAPSSSPAPPTSTQNPQPVANPQLETGQIIEIPGFPPITLPLLFPPPPAPGG